MKRELSKKKGPVGPKEKEKKRPKGSHWWRQKAPAKAHKGGGDHRKEKKLKKADVGGEKRVGLIGLALTQGH